MAEKESKINNISLIATLGLIATLIAIGTPIIKLNTTLTELNTTLKTTNVVVYQTCEKVDDLIVRVVKLESK